MILLTESMELLVAENHIARMVVRLKRMTTVLLRYPIKSLSVKRSVIGDEGMSHVSDITVMLLHRYSTIKNACTVKMMMTMMLN